MRLKNHTDERIVLEPNEEIDVFGDTNRIKLLTQRKTVINVTGVKND